MKLILVVPNFRWSSAHDHTLWHFIPYNLCQLAALVDSNWDTTILDANAEDLTIDAFAERIREMAPDVVGITVLMDQYAPTGHGAAAVVRQLCPGALIVMGGVYPTVSPEIAIADPNLDYVVIGEGEYVLRDLLRFIAGKGPRPTAGLCFREAGVLRNLGRAPFIQILDDLPYPRYDLIDFARYAKSAERRSADAPRAFPFTRLFTSRGCPHHCSFCQVEMIQGRKFRAFSAERVLDEIQWLVGTYGIRSLIFDDDNILADRERARAIFSGMVERDLALPWSAANLAVFMLNRGLLDVMRASGCEMINISIESGNERILKEVIQKPLDLNHAEEMIRYAQSLGIFVAGNIVIGMPEETWNDIRESVKRIEEIGVDYVKIFPAQPLPKTRLWVECEEKQAFRKGFVENYYHMGSRWAFGQIQTKEFTPTDLTILRAYEWDRINFATPGRRARLADIMGLTEAELEKTRRSTLASVRDWLANPQEP